MQLWVKVVPNSKKFAAQFKTNGEMAVHATEEPERGKVNLEIIKELGKMLGMQVRIIRGATSRRKLLEIDGEEDKIMEKLNGMND